MHWSCSTATRPTWFCCTGRYGYGWAPRFQARRRQSARREYLLIALGATNDFNSEAEALQPHAFCDHAPPPWMHAFPLDHIANNIGEVDVPLGRLWFDPRISGFARSNVLRSDRLRFVSSYGRRLAAKNRKPGGNLLTFRCDDLDGIPFEPFGMRQSFLLTLACRASSFVLFAVSIRGFPVSAVFRMRV